MSAPYISPNYMIPPPPVTYSVQTNACRTKVVAIFIVLLMVIIFAVTIFVLAYTKTLVKTATTIESVM